MKTLGLSVILAFCALACAQDSSDLFDKAPPAIDEALRARVTTFFQAHVDGKFRLADQLVAEDSKDAFFEADKPRYKSCQIIRIKYSENFTKADVVTACRNEVLFPSGRMVATIPVGSHWKIQNGEWFWVFSPVRETETPFGIMRAPAPENSDSAAAPTGIPKDPLAAASSILAQVTVEPTSVSVEQAHSSKQAIHVKNGMPGPVEISVDPTGLPSLTMKPVKSQLGAGEETDVMVTYNFDDPAIQCQACLTHPTPLPPMTVALHIRPTGKEVPIQIIFTREQVKK